MELKLGLGLGVSTSISKFDKTTTCWESNKAVFGSALNHDQHNHNLDLQQRKRSFNEAFDDDKDDDSSSNSVEIPRTLSLFSSDHFNEDTINNKRIDEGFEINSAIGWPPIKPCRKKISWHSSSLYVKVKMEGVGIARKVDLSKYHSYQTLAYTLVDLFGKSEEDIKDYKLTYQDKEGDWLLAGDLPWESFRRSVQCLKWIRNED